MSDTPPDSRPPAPSGAPAPPQPPRLVDAMPRPLGALFALAALVAATFVVIGLMHPPSKIALEDRRPPPKAGFTHYAGKIAPLPVPATVPIAESVCPALRTAKPLAGGEGILRIRAALAGLCTLSHGGAGAEVGTAFGAFGAQPISIRFAGFARTGLDSTADVGARTIWLNSRFALHKIKPADLAPLIVHEAYHIASALIPEHENASFANEEWFARNAELETCRALIDIRKWPPGCKDARALVALGRDRFVAALVAAGYSDSPIGLSSP